MNKMIFIVSNEMLSTIEKADARLISAQAMLELAEDKGTIRLRNPGKFISYDPDSIMWLAADNTGGECFIEEFRSFRKAVNWLMDEVES